MLRMEISYYWKEKSLLQIAADVPTIHTPYKSSEAAVADKGAARWSPCWGGAVAPVSVVGQCIVPVSRTRVT